MDRPVTLPDALDILAATHKFSPAELRELNQARSAVIENASLRERLAAANEAGENLHAKWRESLASAAVPSSADGKTEADTARLDWLQRQTKGYGRGWIVRESSSGRGMRLHETSRDNAKPTVREAIDAAMNSERGKVG